MSRNGAGAAASRREEGLETIPGDVLVRTDLRRLDLSGNALRRLDGLESLSLLSTLNVSRNQLSSKALQPLLNAARELVVLNAGHNRIKKLPDLTACAGLKALLLNRNSLRLVRALPNLKVLNTLVLSHNELKAIGAGALAALPSLKKLSLSHNALSTFPDVRGNPDLVELRLNSNAMERVPGWLAEGAPSLRLLDLGSNKLADWAATGPLHRMELHNVTLAGNPLCGAAAEPAGVGSWAAASAQDGDGDEDKAVSAETAAVSAYRAEAMALLKHLRVLDGRVVGATAERLRKRKLRVEAKRRAGLPLGVLADGDNQGSGGARGESGRGESGRGESGRGMWVRGESTRALAGREGRPRGNPTGAGEQRRQLARGGAQPEGDTPTGGKREAKKAAKRARAKGAAPAGGAVTNKHLDTTDTNGGGRDGVLPHKRRRRQEEPHPESVDRRDGPSAPSKASSTAAHTPPDASPTTAAPGKPTAATEDTRSGVVAVISKKRGEASEAGRASDAVVSSGQASSVADRVRAADPLLQVGSGLGGGWD